MFSIFINLGLGALMSICLRMAETLRYGHYFQLIYGILLLPVLPSVSKEEFVQSMTLSSLCKYFIYGLFITMVCLFSSKKCVYLGTIPFFSFVSNVQLIFAPLIQMIALGVTARYLFKANTSPYLFCFIWMGVMLTTSLMIFKHC